MTCTYTDTDGWTLPSGEPCGENHCLIGRRKVCTIHIPETHFVCPGCLGDARNDLQRIVYASALMLPEAIHRGVNSEAANLAGPAPHPGTTRARFRKAQGELMEAATTEHGFDFDTYNAAYDRLPDDDIDHPYGLLGRWEMMLREDYGTPSDELITVAGAADYLSRILFRFAQDPMQDFPLFAREVRHCANHLEAVLRANPQIERGAPCHLCGQGDWTKRYAEARGHGDRAGYRLDPDGHRIPADYWQCDRCEQQLSDEDYRRIVRTSHVATADKLTLPDLATRTGIPHSTLRRWASGEWRNGTKTPPLIEPVGQEKGRNTYRVTDAETLRDRDTVSTEGAV